MPSVLKDNAAKIAAVMGVELLVFLQGLYCYHAISSSKSVFLFTGAALFLIAVFAYVVLRTASRGEEVSKGVRRRWCAHAFLGAIIVLGSVYMVVFPPNSVPDEHFHFQCSYKYSDILTGQEVSDSEMTIRVEDQPLFADQRIMVSASHYRAVLSESSLFADEEGTTTASAFSKFDVSGNPIQLKAASVLGLTLGKVLGLGAYPAYYLGRFFNLLSFAVLAFLAVKFTPFGRGIFMAVSLLPMTLHLAASYSYDVALIGMAMLLTSLCLKAVFEKGKIKPGLLIAIVALVILIAPCKVIYTAIAVLVLFIPKERFVSRRMCLMVKGGVLLAAALSVLAMRASSLISLSGVDVQDAAASNGGRPLDHRGADEGYFYTLSDVLADPLNTFYLYLTMFGAIGDWHVATAVGSQLGWFQDSIAANDLIVFGFLILLLASAMRSEDVDEDISSALRVTMLVAASLVWAAAAASMLLGHTFVGEPYIMGVQGRYILPVLPLLLFGLQTKAITLKGDPTPILMLCFFSLNLLYLNNVFARALTM